MARAPRWPDYCEVVGLNLKHNAVTLRISHNGDSVQITVPNDLESHPQHRASVIVAWAELVDKHNRLAKITKRLTR